MTEEKKDERPIERWFCAGLRVSTDGKRMTGWLEPGGQIYYFTEKTTFALGFAYDVRVTRKGDDGVTRGKPVYVGRAKPEEVPEETLNQWRMANLDAEQHLARQSREKKAKSSDPLADAMLPLNTYAHACRTTSQRDALIADVIRRLNVAWLRG